MRIAIDGGTWGNARGYGRFTRELVRALPRVDAHHEYLLYLDPFTSRAEIPDRIDVKVVPLRESPSRAASADGRRSLADIWRMAAAFARAAADVIFFPSVYTYVPLLTHTPAVVCMHDVIAERFPAYVFRSRRARIFWTLKTRAAVRQADRLVTVSNHARAGIAEVFGVAAHSIRVLGEAPAAAFRPIEDRSALDAIRVRFGIAAAARVVLYFGGLSPHKNVLGLLDAFADLTRDAAFHDVWLVLAGDVQRDVFLSASDAIRARAAELACARIVFTGGVDDEDLTRLINASTVVALPSFDEGLGLPGIEAAACGTPVVATRSSALPDLLGDAALYIDPRDPADLTAALKRVLSDDALRRDLSARALARARHMSWDDSARRVIEVFEELRAS